MRIFLQILVLTSFVVISSSHIYAQKKRYFYDKKKECHICGKKFNVKIKNEKRITIRLGMVYRIDDDSDFNYAKKSMLQRNCYAECIHSCPRCHYSDYYWGFSRYQDEDRNEIIKILEDYKSIEIDDIIENDIAMKIIKHRSNNQFQLGVLNLFNSYLLDTTQLERKREYQRQAISHFESVDLKKKISSIKEFCKLVDTQIGYPYGVVFMKDGDKLIHSGILYLIGELYRRTGEFEKAITYFDKVLVEGDDMIKVKAKLQRQKALEKNDINI